MMPMNDVQWMLYRHTCVPVLTTAVVCTVRPLHGSRQNGQATLYLF